MIPVYLKPNDQAWALGVAHRRWDYVVKHRLKSRYAGADERKHQVGAMAELAFCRALHLEWPATVNTFSDPTIPDVNPDWEVRYLKDWRGIKVLEKDHDDRLVAWVAGKIPRFEIMGYLRAGGVKKHPEWWRPLKDGPLWLAPETRMAPIDPGFHDTCSDARDDWGLWWCPFCGRGFDAT